MDNDNIVLMNFNALYHTPFSLKIFAIIGQYWELDKGWTEFRNKPRFGSALVAIVEDIRVRYTNNDGEIIYAGKGDIIYVPYAARYVFEVLEISPKNDINEHTFKSITINYNMFDEQENIIIMSDRPVKLVEGYQQNVMAKFVSLHNSSFRNCPMYVNSQLYSIMYDITNIQLNLSSSYRLIKTGVTMLQQDFNKNISTAELAESCSLSESHFRKIFKDHTGMTPIEYRNRLRISHARDLLMDRNVSIASVAAAVGINDQFYFSRLFKSIEGISPIDFKNQK